MRDSVPVLQKRGMALTARSARLAQAPAKAALASAEQVGQRTQALQAWFAPAVSPEEGAEKGGNDATDTAAAAAVLGASADAAVVPVVRGRGQRRPPMRMLLHSAALSAQPSGAADAAPVDTSDAHDKPAPAHAVPSDTATAAHPTAAHLLSRISTRGGGNANSEAAAAAAAPSSDPSYSAHPSRSTHSPKHSSPSNPAAPAALDPTGGAAATEARSPDNSSGINTHSDVGVSQQQQQVHVPSLSAVQAANLVPGTSQPAPALNGNASPSERKQQQQEEASGGTAGAWHSTAETRKQRQRMSTPAQGDEALHTRRIRSPVPLSAALDSPQQTALDPPQPPQQTAQTPHQRSSSAPDRPRDSAPGKLDKPDTDKRPRSAPDKPDKRDKRDKPNAQRSHEPPPAQQTRKRPSSISRASGNHREAPGTAAAAALIAAARPSVREHSAIGKSAAATPTARTAARDQGANGQAAATPAGANGKSAAATPAERAPLAQPLASIRDAALAQQQQRSHQQDSHLQQSVFDPPAERHRDPQQQQSVFDPATQQQQSKQTKQQHAHQQPSVFDPATQQQQSKQPKQQHAQQQSGIPRHQSVIDVTDSEERVPLDLATLPPSAAAIATASAAAEPQQADLNALKAQLLALMSSKRAKRRRNDEPGTSNAASSHPPSPSATRPASPPAQRARLFSAPLPNVTLSKVTLAAGGRAPGAAAADLLGHGVNTATGREDSMQQDSLRARSESPIRGPFSVSASTWRPPATCAADAAAAAAAGISVAGGDDEDDDVMVIEAAAPPAPTPACVAALPRFYLYLPRYVRMGSGNYTYLYLPIPRYVHMGSGNYSTSYYMLYPSGNLPVVSEC